MCALKHESVVIVLKRSKRT